MSPAPHIQDFLSNVDSLIREGQVEAARKLLSTYELSEMPRSSTVPFAAAARRVNLPLLSIRVLNPVVRPPPRSRIDASPEERAEYAAALIRIGSIREALGILESLSATALPQVLFYQASAYVSQWDYEQAIPLFRRYVECKAVGDYQRVVGEVNFAAALLYEEKFQSADKLLRSLRRETKAPGLQRLRGNTLELSAQLAVLERDWKLAGHWLGLARKTASRAGDLDLLFVDKWDAIAKARRGLKDGLSALRQVRSRARSHGHWETVRDCDRYLALGSRDRGLLIHVYFGTPFDSYRHQLSKELGEDFVFPRSYVWFPGGSKRPGFELDLVGETGASDLGLKPGQLLHRLLGLLCTDFYRPFSLAQIHASLWPDEYFNPTSSPTRVHQATKRLRQWFAEHRLALQLKADRGYFSLTSQSVGLRVPTGLVPRDSDEYWLGKLKERWPKEAFSKEEVGRLLGLAPWSALRLLQRACQRAEVRREGRTSGARYRFAG